MHVSSPLPRRNLVWLSRMRRGHNCSNGSQESSTARVRLSNQPLEPLEYCNLIGLQYFCSGTNSGIRVKPNLPFFHVKVALRPTNHGRRICFDSSDSARLWYVEMKKKQNESIKEFVSAKDVCFFSTYGPNAQFIIYAIIKIWRDILNNGLQVNDSLLGIAEMRFIVWFDS